MQTFKELSKQLYLKAIQFHILSREKYVQDVRCYESRTIPHVVSTMPF